MSSNTVVEFATELKKTPETLLEQLKSSRGRVKIGSFDVSDRVLVQTNKSFWPTCRPAMEVGLADRKKITLVTKSTSEIKRADAQARRTIRSRCARSGVRSSSVMKLRKWLVNRHQWQGLEGCCHNCNSE